MYDRHVFRAASRTRPGHACGPRSDFISNSTLECLQYAHAQTRQQQKQRPAPSVVMPLYTLLHISPSQADSSVPLQIRQLRKRRSQRLPKSWERARGSHKKVANTEQVSIRHSLFSKPHFLSPANGQLDSRLTKESMAWESWLNAACLASRLGQLGYQLISSKQAPRAL